MSILISDIEPQLYARRDGGMDVIIGSDGVTLRFPKGGQPEVSKDKFERAIAEEVFVQAPREVFKKVLTSYASAAGVPPGIEPVRLEFDIAENTATYSWVWWVIKW